jgi:hypothetical protein
MAPGGKKLFAEVDPFSPADGAWYATTAFGFRAFDPSAGENRGSPVGSVVCWKGSLCAMVVGKG